MLMLQVASPARSGPLVATPVTLSAKRGKIRSPAASFVDIQNINSIQYHLKRLQLHHSLLLLANSQEAQLPARNIDLIQTNNLPILRHGADAFQATQIHRINNIC